MKTKLFFKLMFVLISITCFVSCGEKEDKETPVTPTNPTVPTNPTNPENTGDNQTVPVTGGTITKGDITITFPSGTFGSETKVNVVELKSGQTLGEDEQSKFYQLTLPLDIKKDFTVSIKSDSKDENTAFVLHAPSISTHHVSAELQYSDIVVPATYSNGAYTAKIPAANNAGVAKTANITFGLAKVLTSSGSSSRSLTRSANDGDIKWKISWFGWSWIVSSSSTITSVNKEIDDAMTDAVKAIKGLGFKVKGDREIPINIKSFSMGDKEYGAHSQSCLSDSSSVINLNRNLLTGSNFNRTVFRRTIFHELFHYFQSAYDPSGSAWEKCSLNDQPERLRIMEAGGVWIEKLADADGYYDGGWVPHFQYVLKGVLDEGIEDANSTAVGSFQTWGYGSAIVLDWFELKKGKNQILKMYETWRDKKTNVFQTWISESEKACGIEFFGKFSDFVTTTAEGKLNTGIDWTILNPKSGKQKFTVKDWGSERKDITGNGIEIWQSSVYHYGVRCYSVSLHNYKDSNGKSDMKGKVLKINQSQDNINVKVWKLTKATSEMTFMGTITQMNPMKITDESTLKSLLNDAQLYFVAEQKDNSRNQATSEVIIKMEEVEIKTSPETLTFEAAGGTQDVTVLTNQEGFKVKANENWMKVKVKDDATFQVTAEANTSDARTGTVTVYALNEKNEEVATFDLKVQQKGREKGEYDLSKCKYMTIEMTIKAHYTGTWESGQNDVNITVKFPENYWITPSYLADSGHTKTTVNYNGTGAHLECICENDTTWSWFGTHKLERYYKITMDIDDIVSGKITSLTAECNYDYLINGEWGNTEHSWSKEKLTASNIPLPNKAGKSVGNKSTGTTIDSCTRENKQSVAVDYKYSMLSSDDYEIIVKFE